MAWPVPDPTENVKALSEALSDRQDDLRELNNKYLDARLDHMEAMAILRAEHSRELRELEMARSESVHMVDIGNANTAEARAGEAIKTLENQTAAIADAGRIGTANIATTLANQLTQLFAESNKRVSALELSSSEGRGKQAVSDPAMEQLASVVEQLASAQQLSSGRNTGMSDSAKMLVGALMLITALMGIYTFTQRSSANAAQPQFIMMPAPVVAPPSTTTTTTQPFPR